MNYKLFIAICSRASVVPDNETKASSCDPASYQCSNFKCKLMCFLLQLYQKGGKKSDEDPKSWFAT